MQTELAVVLDTIEQRPLPQLILKPRSSMLVSLNRVHPVLFLVFFSKLDDDSDGRAVHTKMADRGRQGLVRKWRVKKIGLC